MDQQRILDKAMEHQRILDKAMEHQRILDKAMEHQRILDKAMEHQRILDKAMEHHRIIDKAMEHQRIFNKAMEHQRIFDKAMERMQASANAAKLFRNLYDPPALRALEAARRTVDQLLQQDFAMKSLDRAELPKWLDSVKAIRPTWDVLLGVRDKVVEHVQGLHAESSPADAIPVADHDVNEIGRLVAPLSDSLKAVSSAENEQLAAINKNIEHGFAQLLKAMKAESKSTNAFVIAQIIIAIVLCFAQIQNDRILANRPVQSQNARPVEIVRQIQSFVVSIEISGLLNQHRIVNVCKLPVHSRAKPGSHCLGKVALGQVVRVIEKRKEWVRIEWNEDLMVRSGWVRSKYLSPLVRNCK